MTMIEGVEIKDLVTHSDERVFFREMIRVTDGFFSEGFGQASHTMTHVGAAKAWHYHKKQIDWWYVVIGVIKAVLHDLRTQSRTHRVTQEVFMGDGYPARVIRIPTMVAHGYKVLAGPMHLVYVTSGVYDPADELRLPHDDPSIGYDWKASVIK